MKEIEQRAKHAQKWRRLLGTGIAKNFLFRSEWCVSVGLCETAGWIYTNQNHFLEWVKPGYRDKK